MCGVVLGEEAAAGGPGKFEAEGVLGMFGCVARGMFVKTFDCEVGLRDGVGLRAGRPPQ